jgi:hypothetical protein
MGKGRWPGNLRRLKENERRMVGLAREKEERRGREGFLHFFKKIFSNSFSNFQTSIKQKSMHLNHDAQTLIISKLF